MSHKCPNCQRVLYDRRLEECGFCGAPIPEELRFTPAEIVELDRKVAKSEAQRRYREQAAELEWEKSSERKAKYNSPSKYGGAAAGCVLGVGLLIVGFSLPAEQGGAARWAGVLGMAFSILVMTIQAGWVSRALVTSVGAAICTGVLFFSAARSEITGKAVYHHKLLSRHGWRTELVTRQEKPEMFRAATNVRWALSIVCAVVSIGSFVFCRKTEYEDVFES